MRRKHASTIVSFAETSAQDDKSTHDTGGDSQKKGHMAAQRGSAAAAVAGREHSLAELDQKPLARQQGAELRDGNHSPSNGEMLEEPAPAAMVLQPSMSSHDASPAGISSNSSAEPVTPLAFPAQQQQTQQPSLVVFSGGTAFNTVAGRRHA
jgi:hypothetical protein